MTTSISRVLVANRGEVACRILRAARQHGLATVAIYAKDDDRSLHVTLADQAIGLDRSGPKAYLDADSIIEAAMDTGCDTLHPGYGFLAESAAFASAAASAGVRFVGPSPTALDALGSKVQARSLAVEHGVAVALGTGLLGSVDELEAFMDHNGLTHVMIKAVAGGRRGRGMRVVARSEDLAAALARCGSEAKTAFGSDAIFAEEYLDDARHIEVQVAADTSGQVVVIGDRDCSLQRRNQKIVEIAPAPNLSVKMRGELGRSAVTLANAVGFQSLGTFEFLVSGDRAVFCEANPRLQVEHTVTEEVTGIDLVQLQFALADGASLAACGLEETPPLSGRTSIQARVNAETMTDSGDPVPSSGVIEEIRWPAGAGIRVESALRSGLPTSQRYDPLLAKVIATSAASFPTFNSGNDQRESPEPEASFDAARRRLEGALSELVLTGVDTNVGFLSSLLARPKVVAATVDTGLVGREAASILAELPPEAAPGSVPVTVAEQTLAPELAPDGAELVNAPLQGTVVAIDAVLGSVVRRGDRLAVLEAMKMEHVIASPCDGTVLAVLVSPEATLQPGQPIVSLKPASVQGDSVTDRAELDPDWIRPDLAESIERHQVGLDAARPDAMARRLKTGQRSARENISDLCDPDSFVEYGALTLAAQRRRRSAEELQRKTPADGMVTGVGSVNGNLFDDDRTQCVVASYDYTVLAGTQGLQNHRKKDRIFALAKQAAMPVVLFTEGGGGRPGDTDGTGVAGLDCLAFRYFAELSGLVPLVGINSGRCFAGNAALLGCCDVVIATENSNIGMGGPAMIEGGGLGVFTPEQVGPMTDQVPNGVVDVAVADEAEAVAAAKKYLSYFQGSVSDWDAPDQRGLRHIVPENRLRVYDVRDAIDLLADTDSVLELRPQFGRGMVTALARIEGRPLGIVANNPLHLGGAIDSDNADKAARFMTLCDAYDLPLLFLCDTPGIMVGPEAERTALVRHAARMFVTAASLTVPIGTIVLRKGYGLGAQAMAGGSFHSSAFTVAWPSGEFGGMGLEGAVRLGYRNELAAIDDAAERQATFDEMVDRMYQIGKGVNMASHFEIDDVIDPASSRPWALSMLKTATQEPAKTRAATKTKKRPFIDTW